MYDHEARKRKWKGSEAARKVARENGPGEIEGSERARKSAKETRPGAMSGRPGFDNERVPGFPSV